MASSAVFLLGQWPFIIVIIIIIIIIVYTTQ